MLLAKLEAYSLDNNAVSFMRGYLTNRFQRCKINNSFSEWAKIFDGITQGSLLDPLLFNIFIKDIFLFSQKCDLTNESDKRVSTIINSLRHDFTILSKWFYNNFMVLNTEKCSSMLLGVDDSLQTNLVCGD